MIKIDLYCFDMLVLSLYLVGFVAIKIKKSPPNYLSPVH